MKKKLKKLQKKYKKLKRFQKVIDQQEKLYNAFFKKYKLPPSISAAIILSDKLEMMPLDKKLANRIENKLLYIAKQIGLK